MSRILHVITGLSRGGAEELLFRLCITDVANVHAVISLTTLGVYGPLLAVRGIEVHCLSGSSGSLRIYDLFRLWSILRTVQPDVVHCWLYHSNLIAGIVARLSGVSAVIWSLHSSFLDSSTSKLSTRLVSRLAAPLSYFVPAAIVCCSDSVRAAHLQYGYDSCKLVVIPNGFDLDLFAYSEQASSAIRAEMGVGSSTLLFGMVARFSREKDYRTLLIAIDILRNSCGDFKCVLVGNGLTPENNELMDWIGQLCLLDFVILLGPRGDVPAIMSAIDVHVLSSLTEALPNVLIEAMACETPCVSSRVGDTSYIVGETGWIVPARDPCALAHAMSQSIQESRADRIVRGKLCRTRVESLFSLDRMTDSYLSLYRLVSMDINRPVVN